MFRQPSGTIFSVDVSNRISDMKYLAAKAYLFFILRIKVCDFSHTSAWLLQGLRFSSIHIRDGLV